MSGNLHNRGPCNLGYRLMCAWREFHSSAATLTNKHVAIELRLNTFGLLVSTIASYSFSSAPLTVSQLSKLDAMQRKMLRIIAGWVRWNDEHWDDTSDGMKMRLYTALNMYHILTWSITRNALREKLTAKFVGMHGSLLVNRLFV